MYLCTYAVSAEIVVLAGGFVGCTGLNRIVWLYMSGNHRGWMRAARRLISWSCWIRSAGATSVLVEQHHVQLSPMILMVLHADVPNVKAQSLVRTYSLPLAISQWLADLHQRRTDANLSKDSSLVSIVIRHTHGNCRRLVFS